MQPIQLRFTYSEAEYLNASRLLLMRETKVILRLAVMFLLLFSGGVMLTMLIPLFSFPLWAMVLIALVFVAIFFQKLLVDMPRRYFRGNDNMREEFLLTFSHDGVWVRTSKIDSKMAWSLYTRVLENPSMYVIVYGTDARMMTAVPKRVFRSVQEEVEFRNLLRQHVDDRLPLTTPSIEARTPEYIPSGSQPPDWR
jgi:hypothetical protein